MGTVRHKGYIPWDDDIDMLMFREDYDKLIELADSEFKDPYFLQCAYTEKHYYRGHAQMRYKGTTAILKGDIYQPFDQSIFLDIFVYDGTLSPIVDNPECAFMSDSVSTLLQI